MKKKILMRLVVVLLVLTSVACQATPVPAPAPTATSTPTNTATSVPTNTVAPTLTPVSPTPTTTPVEANMQCDVWCWLEGPAGDLSSRNPKTGLDARITGRNAILDNIAKIMVKFPSGDIIIPRPHGDIPYGLEGRFGRMTPGLPQAGTYTFTALDADGQPILGASCSDVYFGGYEPAPPSNVQTEVIKTGILVTWDSSPIIPGAFEPNGSPPLGFYSIYFIREKGEELLYGWNHGDWPLPETSHIIPFRRQDFGPGDAGLALEEMDDGIYYLRMDTFSDEPEPERTRTAGQHAECIAHDPAQNIRIVIEGSQVRIEGP